MITTGPNYNRLAEAYKIIEDVRDENHANVTVNHHARTALYAIAELAVLLDIDFQKEQS